MPTARIWQTKLGSTATTRRRQLEVCETHEGLSFAVQWVAAKIDNQIRSLNELAKRRPDDKEPLETVAGSLQQLCEKIASTTGE